MRRPPCVSSSVVYVLVSVCLLAAGCSSSGTVTRTDGTEVRGRIVGRTATTLVLHDEREHETHEVALDAIAELDHPGNVAMVTGIVIGGLSLIPLTLGLSTIADSYEDGSGFGYAFGVLITLVGLPPLATGLGLAIEGGLRWSSSREAAEQPYGAAGAAGSVKVLPWVAPHGEGVVGGAGVAMRF